MASVAVRVSPVESLRARYRNVEVAADRPELRFELQNASASAWATESAPVLSYQIFDERSGNLLVEGNRIALPGTMAPGDSVALRMAIDVPAEPGSYRLHAGLMREEAGWAYDAGCNFIAARVRVSKGGKRAFSKPLETDLARLRRRYRWRLLGRLLVEPFGTVWRNRSLSATLVKREILSRSRGSFFGSLWTVLSPFLLMVTYFFVFGVVLKARFGANPSRTMFALYFLAGMMPWLAFSEAAARAPMVLIEYRQLIKKLVFPIETLPVNLVWSGLVGEAFGLVLFALACVFVQHGLPWTVLYLPALLVPQVIFTAGVCWIMSVLGAFLRDLVQVNGFLLTLWFFITPICYPETQIPEGARRWLTKNPVYILVRAYRSIFLEAHAPDWKSLAELTVFALGLAVAGHAWFYKLRKTFIDVL